MRVYCKEWLQLLHSGFIFDIQYFLDTKNKVLLCDLDFFNYLNYYLNFYIFFKLSLQKII